MSQGRCLARVGGGRRRGETEGGAAVRGEKEEPRGRLKCLAGFRAPGL